MELYKLYQLIRFFTIKFNYTSIMFKGYSKTNEMFLFNKDNKTYQVIRLTTDTLDETYYDIERINEIFDLIRKKIKINDFTFLDIHISKDTVGIENFETVCIEDNFYSGKDVSDSYPGISNVIRKVKDPNNELKEIVEELNKNFLVSRRQKTKLHFGPYFITYILMFFCLINYLITFFLERNGFSSSAALIALGADYKTFTLGLNQIYRLFTYSFNHGSLFHLFANVYSLFLIGKYIEEKYGHLKYSAVLILSILAGSLTNGIIVDNNLLVGMSAGVYGLWGLYIFEVIFNRYPVSRSFYYVIFINLMLNFMSGIAWYAHIAGLIIGLLCYFLFRDEKLNVSYIIVICLLFGGLGYKYFSNRKISPLYPGTDSEVIQIYNEYIGKEYSNRIGYNLTKIYVKNGLIEGANNG